MKSPYRLIPSSVACYTVGRDTAAAITVQHTTVSRLHAEVIPLPDGRIYVTDCASRNGTFINDGGHWRKISQDFAGVAARLRFGEVETSVPHLLALITGLQSSSSAGAAGQPVAESEDKLDASQGVALNPETGEPVALAAPSDEDPVR